MHPMVIDRRTCLTGGVACALSAAAPAVFAGVPSGPAPAARFAAARKSPDGAHSAAIFRADGRDVNAVALPARGHDVTACPVTRTVVAFARRPGNFAVAFRDDPAWRPIRFTTPPDRHFYGHGVFSRDGRLLFATENNFEAGTGCVGIYDATAQFRRIGEWDGHGVGPHDIALMPDGRTLVVANGGIETHPHIGGGRAKLNLATMSPSLVYLNADNGDLIERHELPPDMRRLSLRHLDIGAARTVVLGGQLQTGAGPDTPLILSHRLGEKPRPLELPRTLVAALRGYISSVAVDRAGEIAALTASRGGQVVFVDVATGQLMGTRALTDVSGVAAADNGFLLTSGTGHVATNGATAQTPWAWDNHAVRI